MPEKYRVSNDAGEFDEAASSRKLADAYRSLESKLGKGAAMTVPETAEGYKIEAPVGEDGKPSMDLSINPNGSALAIEGITSPDGRVLGKMGHAERRGDNLYRNVPEHVPGDKFMPIFESGVAYFA